ncbi:MAG: Ger(x)C family spore germination C-terminal domain-containing protein, partial [Clostridia bacterium]|nr:Ger(x)C family spore germination C-terminal domain-containing protein [Clostridia bacterium]
AAGRDYASALYALNAAIPRALNLTQVKSLIISEEMASSPDFPALLREFKLSRLDGEASLIVCQDEAKALLDAQQPLIGLRLSDTLVTEMDRYRRLGCIPRSTLAGVFYDAESVYSDPVAILAAVTPESGADEFAYQRENRDAYFGAALFRGGVMAGTLTGGETQLLQLVRDGDARMPMPLDNAWLVVARQGLVRLHVDLSGDAPRIEVSFTVSVEDLRGDADMDTVGRELTEGLDALTRRCQALGVEPFGYARWAAAQFPTLQAWQAWNWRDQFSQAEVIYHLTVKRTNE